MTDLLQAAVMTGTGRAAQIGRPVAGKTGTTSSNKDGWFIGFSSGLTTGVWMGRDDARAIAGLQGGTAPARAFHDFMTVAVARRPVENFQTEVPDARLGHRRRGRSLCATRSRSIRWSTKSAIPFRASRSTRCRRHRTSNRNSRHSGSRRPASWISNGSTRSCPQAVPAAAAASAPAAAAAAGRQASAADLTASGRSASAGPRSVAAITARRPRRLRTAYAPAP